MIHFFSITFLLSFTLTSFAFTLTEEPLECLAPEEPLSSCTEAGLSKMKAHFPPAVLNKAMEVSTKHHGTLCQYCRPQANPEIDKQTGYYKLDTTSVLDACNDMVISGAIEGVGDMAKFVFKLGVGSVKMVLHGETLGDKINELLLKSLTTRSNLDLARILVEKCPKIEASERPECLNYAYKYDKTINSFRRELAGHSGLEDKINPRLKEILIQDIVATEIKKMSKITMEKVEGYECLPLNQRTLIACDMTGEVILAPFLAGLGVKAAGALVSRVPGLGKLHAPKMGASSAAKEIPFVAPKSVPGKTGPNMKVTLQRSTNPKIYTPRPSQYGVTGNSAEEVLGANPPVGFKQAGRQANPESIQFVSEHKIGFQQKASTALSEAKIPVHGDKVAGFQQKAAGQLIETVPAASAPTGAGFKKAAQEVAARADPPLSKNIAPIGFEQRAAGKIAAPALDSQKNRSAGFLQAGQKTTHQPQVQLNIGTQPAGFKPIKKVED